MIHYRDFNWVSTARVARKNVGIGIIVSAEGQGPTIKTKIKVMSAAMAKFGLKVGDRVSVGYQRYFEVNDHGYPQVALAVCIVKDEHGELVLKRLQKAKVSAATDSCHLSIYPPIDIEDTEFTLDKLSSESIKVGEDPDGAPVTREAVIAMKAL